jgi:hypothetical protein
MSRMLSLMALSLLLLLACTSCRDTSAQSRTENSTEEFLRVLKQAQEKSAAKEWSNAIVLWEKVVQLNPVSGEYWYQLAEARYQHGRKARTRSAVEQRRRYDHRATVDSRPDSQRQNQSARQAVCRHRTPHLLRRAKHRDLHRTPHKRDLRWRTYRFQSQFHWRRQCVRAALQQADDERVRFVLAKFMAGRSSPVDCAAALCTAYVRGFARQSGRGNGSDSGVSKLRA